MYSLLRVCAAFTVTMLSDKWSLSRQIGDGKQWKSHPGHRCHHLCGSVHHHRGGCGGLPVHTAHHVTPEKVSKRYDTTTYLFFVLFLSIRLSINESWVCCFSPLSLFLTNCSPCEATRIVITEVCYFHSGSPVSHNSQPIIVKKNIKKRNGLCSRCFSWLWSYQPKLLTVLWRFHDPMAFLSVRLFSPFPLPFCHTGSGQPPSPPTAHTNTKATPKTWNRPIFGSTMSGWSSNQWTSHRNRTRSWPKHPSPAPPKTLLQLTAGWRATPTCNRGETPSVVSLWGE